MDEFLPNGVAVCCLEDQMMIAEVEAEELARASHELLLRALSAFERTEAIREKWGLHERR